MANDTLLTDEYVAELLARDAAERSAGYSSRGLEAYRSASAKPGNKAKPNTRFLQNIIKSTKNHNDALLAKETAESRARLHGLAEAHQQKQRRYKPDAGDTRRRQLGAISAILAGKGKHDGHGDPDRTADAADTPIETTRPVRRDEERAKSERKRHRERSRSPAGRRAWRERAYRERSPEKRRHRADSSDFEAASGAEAPRNDPRKDKRGQDGSHGRGQGESDRARGLASEREKERSWRSGPLRGELMDRILPTHEAREERRTTREASSDQHRTRQKRASGSHREAKRASRQGVSRQGSPQREDLLHARVSERARRHRLAEEGCSGAHDDDGADSMDDECIGPAPPVSVRGRGRGAASGSSAMDSRFSHDYDPSADGAPAPDATEDWDEAVEAYRGRQKWRQEGAGRLRTAGFTGEQIQTWEKGGDPLERDVLWGTKGEKREWDRGKVDLDGATKAAPDWAQ